MEDKLQPERRHGIAETCRLVDAIRRVAFDLSLTNDDIARTVRDLLNEHNDTAGGTP